MANIRFNPWRKEYKRPFGAIKAGQAAEFMIEVYDAYVKSVELEIYRDGESTPCILQMEDQHDGRYCCTYTAGSAGLLFYYFKLVLYENNSEQTYYYCLGLGVTQNEGELSEHSYQLTVYEHGVEAPDWYQDAVCYQIFPDRFANGNPDGRIDGRKQNSFIYGTDSDLPMYIRNKDGGIDRWDFYGGNIRGIIEKIPYLKELGITMIYLNPVFEATSNHRYDTNDYMKIDPMLGTEDDFAELLQKLHANGIHVILDGVFNHVGKNSRYFNAGGLYGDDEGAFRNKESKYYSWFRFIHYPDSYDSWWGVSDLPTVDKENPDYQQFIYGKKDSVISKWTGFGVDGWRLDVADELTDDFIENIRKTLDDYKERVLIGEVWEDASNKVAYSKRRRYVYGNGLYGVMNYPLRKCIIDLVLSSRSPLEIAHELMQLRENYPRDFFFNSLNNLDTHDTKRIITACSGKMQLVRTAWELLFMFPGIPCVYYGDEAGLVGDSDPDNRRFFPWGHENQEMLQFMKRLISKRRASQVLSRGELSLFVSGTFFGIGRFLGDEAVAYLVNASDCEAEFNPDQLQSFHDEAGLGAKLCQAFANKKFGAWESVEI